MYICIGPYCWGRATTTGAAIRGAKKAFPAFSGSAKTMAYDVYEVHDDAYVNEQGNIVSPEPPKKIREVRFVGTQRTVKEKFDAPVPRV